MQQFDLPQYADCRLCVVFSNNRFKHEELSLHRVVIAQSPPLAALLGSGETDNNGLSLVHLEVPSSFVDPITVRCALRICYGQSPWDFVGLEKSEKSSQLVREDWINWMQNALAFAASGIILQLVDVVSRGTQIASSIVGWDNIETALKFVMEGVVEDVPENNSNAETVQQLQGLGISNGSAPSTISMQPLGKVNPSMTILRPYTHGVAAYRLKQVCLRFMSDQLSLFKDWTLNKSAPPLTYLDRLPIKVDSRPSSSSSRLCHIQFGSLPREVPEDSDSVGFQLSSIVLSMPFVLLQELIEQIEHVVSTEMIMSIVAERERRRQTVLRDKYVSYSQRLAMPETWAPVGWQEVLKAVDIDGTRQTTILRTWTGFRNPLDVQ